MASDEVIQKIDTALCADTVEWCPLSGLEHILLLGTYQLESETNSPSHQTGLDQPSSPVPQTRIGGVIVYGLELQNNSEPQLIEQSRLDLCGVLDIKWKESCSNNGTPLFSLVDAEGFCQLMSIDEAYNIKNVAKSELSDSSLGLSLGFSDNGKSQVVASDSAGSLTVMDVEANLKSTLSWHCHEYEAWITAFHKFDNNFVFSGGDDCRLKGWDLRDISRPAFVSKRHQMGVCSVQSHPFEEHVFASGSYDEEVVVWDRRSMKTPITSVSLGGGVWRIKWNPNGGSHILTATMYNGTHIIDYHNRGADCMQIVAHHGGHNLAYGADWCRLNRNGLPLTQYEEGSRSDSLDDENSLTYLISTCSFYDHSLHLWEWSSIIK